MKPNDGCWCPIIVKNSKIPKLLSWFINARAITLFPFIFIRDEGDEKLIRHESIHIAQYRELFVIGFLLIYLYDFVHGFIKYRNYSDAYKSIRFEREAYIQQADPHYLQFREHFAWTRYKV
jgi:hypothetical protein